MKSLTALLAVSLVTACASPAVVQTRQPKDTEMTCKQLQDAFSEAQEFEQNARKERGVTGTNVAAAIFFWPAMLGTYANTEEAINAAKDRQRHLQKLGDQKNCQLI
jgi:outer membrane biogenesis lipoprotein LolB